MTNYNIPKDEFIKFIDERIDNYMSGYQAASVPA